MIAHRYLPRKRSLARVAIAQLVEETEPDTPDEPAATEEQEMEEQIRLHDLRMGAVVSALKSVGARRVLDLGCGSGKLLERLLPDPHFTEIVGLDVSHRSLDVAERRLHLERLSPEARERIKLLHGSLTYRDRRIEGYDAAAVVEVIEHLDPWRLGAFERVLFDACRPGTVVVTTPNREYNALFEGLEPGKLRHRDHRFEWTRSEFADWAQDVGTRSGYGFRLLGVGPEDPDLGPPTQMAVFTIGEGSG
jgi:3' terminal RNA ribose 2'-O-methyltransferase Hen1